MVSSILPSLARPPAVADVVVVAAAAVVVGGGGAAATGPQPSVAKLLVLVLDGKPLQ
jgi:hypothetical protein